MPKHTLVGTFPQRLGDASERYRSALIPTSQERRERSVWGRAYRHGELVCARVHVTIGHDTRIGLARHERRDVRARFQERIDGTLRSELITLVRRHAAAARRIADGLDTIELVLDDPDGEQRRITGQLQPPLVRHGRLREIEFGLHVLEPRG